VGQMDRGPPYLPGDGRASPEVSAAVDHPAWSNRNGRNRDADQ
jgi:hypothetical protein